MFQTLISAADTYHFFASWISAIATILIAVLGIYQLKQIANQIKINGEREKKWATIKVCEKYDTDPIISDYTKTIWQKTKNGTDYLNAKEVLHEIIGFLNYLESISIGVFQNVYKEEIIKDHFETIIYKAVKVFIKGQPGEVDGRAWEVSGPIVPPKGFECLLRLYDDWFKEEMLVTYKDET